MSRTKTKTKKYRVIYKRTAYSRPRKTVVSWRDGQSLSRKINRATGGGRMIGIRQIR